MGQRAMCLGILLAGCSADVTEFAASQVGLRRVGVATSVPLGRDPLALSDVPDDGLAMLHALSYGTPSVDSFAVADERLYLGGMGIDGIGVRSGSLLRARLSDGRRQPSPLFEGGAVHVAISDGRGGMYVGGSFRRANDVPVRGLAHVLADGRLDRRCQLSVIGEIRSLALSDNWLVIGGSFVSVQGQSRENLATIEVPPNGLGGSVTPWAPIQRRDNSPYRFS